MCAQPFDHDYKLLIYFRFLHIDYFSPRSKEKILSNVNRCYYKAFDERELNDSEKVALFITSND